MVLGWRDIARLLAWPLVLVVVLVVAVVLLMR